MRPSECLFYAAVLALFGVGSAASADTSVPPPARVVSINMCTDQLALELAAPGQLISVTRMGQTSNPPPLDTMAQELHGNVGQAEEIYLLQPDLVLAGTFTAPATLRMLENLGIPVARFPPATSLDDIPELMARMGEVLGQTDIAATRIAEFKAQRARLSTPPARRPRVALTYVNSFLPGDDTLAGDILRAAGFDNVAREAGLSSVGKLALETVVMLAPEVIISGQDFPGAARAEDSLAHPALRALTDTFFAGSLTSATWTCGSPRVLEAVQDMVDLRNEVLSR